MQKNCLLIVFSLLIASCYCQLGFGGLWTDTFFGGNFSICVDGNNAWGLYSEYGIAVGTISEDGLTWTGDTYQGGVVSSEAGWCEFGPFYLTLVDNGTSLEGKYGCRETPVFSWTARRINADNQSDHDCAKVMSFKSTNNILDGRWWKPTNGKSSQVDFCTSTDNTYEASYDNPTFTPEGFDEGTWYHNRKIATGKFYRANNNGALPGTSLWLINPDGNLVNIWWAGLTGNFNIQEINDTRIHGYDIYEYAHGTTEGVCSRFSALAGQKFDYYPYEQELFYFSTFEEDISYYSIPVAVNATSGSSGAQSSGAQSSVSSNNNSSDASVLAYSFAVLLITLLFC